MRFESAHFDFSAMMSQKELLDQLMGKDRNLSREEKRNAAPQITWNDDNSQCPHYLCGFCPHVIFTNTKSDLGPCRRNHDRAYRKEFPNAPEWYRRRAEDTFCRYLERLLVDVDRRIANGKDRLDQKMELDMTNPEIIARLDRITQLNKGADEILDRIEKLGEDGLVDEAFAAVGAMDALLNEKKVLESYNEATQTESGPQEKQMIVCDVCGAFLVENDVESRVQSHLEGKQHLGYNEIREKLASIRQTIKDRGPIETGSGGRHQSPDRRDYHRYNNSSRSRGSYDERGNDRKRSRDDIHNNRRSGDRYQRRSRSRERHRRRW